MGRPPFVSGLAVAMLAALPALTFAQSAPTPATREPGANAPTDLSSAKPGRDHNPHAFTTWLAERPQAWRYRD